MLGFMDMNNTLGPSRRYKGIFASSADPSGQTLSLFIESIAKVAIGGAGWLAVAHGLDPAAATSQVQALLDVAAQVIPLAYSLYHSLQAGWGILRKLIAMFATTAA